MRTPTFRDAVKKALRDELAADPSVVLFGEDVAAAGGVFQATRGLVDEFGPRRVFDTPISELAMAGTAFGSAVTGLHPVIEIMFGDFAALAADSLINQAAKVGYWSGGAVIAPITVRTTFGAGGRFGAIHSQSPAGLFMNVPEIKIVAPSTPEDAYGLLRAAIQDPGPVVFLEHKFLYQTRAATPDVGCEPIPLGVARIVREGTDGTVVAATSCVSRAVDAAERVAADGVSVAVIDPRTIKPLDIDTVVASVEQTGVLLIVDEGPRFGNWTGELAAEVCERVPGTRVRRIGGPDHPLPFSPVLEDAVLPSTDVIAAELTHIAKSARSSTAKTEEPAR